MTPELRRISLGDFAANLTAIVERVASAGESVVATSEPSRTRITHAIAITNPAKDRRSDAGSTRVASREPRKEPAIAAAAIASTSG